MVVTSTKLVMVAALDPYTVTELQGSDWESHTSNLKALNLGYFKVENSEVCKACIDKEGWTYYSSADYQTGHCCLFDCTIKFERNDRLGWDKLTDGSPY